MDIEATATKVIWGALKNSGQVCVASKRIFVHESIYQQFLASLVEAAKSLKVGMGNEEGVKLGPIQNKMQYEKTLDLFRDSIENAHRFVLGGEVQECKGYFVHPVIIDNPGSDSELWSGEAFGIVGFPS